KGDYNDKTPLFSACESGNENLVKYLMEQGAEINVMSRCNHTPLYTACQSGYENIVKCLLEHGA
ncbi:ankyrin, partial [Anaeromyces robustus]